MDAPDSRTRRKIALNSRTGLSPSASARIFSEVILPGLVLVASLWTAKEWLLSRDVPKSWVLMRTLACSALVHLAREAWTGNTVKIAHSVNLSMLPAFGILSVSFLLQQTCLLIALSHTSSTRVAAYVLFSLACAKAFSNSSMFPRVIPVFIGLAWSFASDASYSVNTVRDALPGHLALAAHVPLTCSVEYFHAQLSVKLGPATASAAGSLGASLLAVGAYAAREASYTFKPHATVVPLTYLLTIPLLAYTAQPSSSSLQLSTSLTPQIYTLSGSIVVGASLILNVIFGDAKPSLIDLTIPILVLYGGHPVKSKSDSGVPETPLSLVLRSHLKTIMDNAESRKIFYFLMLNISFMFVQMLYGIWTNSLGLISDAIHMGFDCMAIGVGLFASIMATWPPNERFTYGYGRIETLSGFANGIFLVLISMFIIFEAIQRLLDPPEMNTNQLLLISTLGLGVNLFGMFAMGGHHHHGHGHSHGHDHGHDHGHSHSHAHVHNHGIAAHTHNRTHDHAHDHGHSLHDHGYGHDHEHDHDHEHEHEHDHEHDHASHSHSDAHAHDHGHSHEHSHNHEHSHGHDHSGHVHGESCAHDDHDHHHNGAEKPLTNGDSHSTHSHSPESPTFPARGHARTNSNARVAFTFPQRRSAPRMGAHNGHSHQHPPALRINDSLAMRHVHGPSLDGPYVSVPPKTPADLEGIFSPVTPCYQFGVDEHFAAHAPVHTPNLHDHSHTHHDHEHHGHSDNMRGVFLHVMADTLGSVGVIISTLLIQFYGWTGFDPIASLFIAILIAASVIPLIIDTGKVLALDVTHRSSDIEHALGELSSIAGLVSYTAPQFWPKDSESVIGSIHIQLARATGLDRVVKHVDDLLREKISGLDELTIQVEVLELHMND